MPSAWVARRPRKSGGVTYRVMFRIGGRESAPRYAGAFSTMREARLRRDWVAGELASCRVPRIQTLEPVAAPTLRAIAKRWAESRVDVTDATVTYHRTALRRAESLMERPVDAITPADVAELVASLSAAGKARETIRKTVTVLSMVFDHAAVTPNPARDRIRVRLPREERPEISPPTHEHVDAVHRLLAPLYKLPLVVLDATGMRVGELEQLTWGDVDEQRGRWRVSQAVAKTRRGRWGTVPPDVFAAVCELCPRDDRVPGRRVFQEFGVGRFRTAIGRACTAAGVPVFSPHDLRHRRISLMHLGGVPWARIGEQVGQRDLAVTANTYTHVMSDETELDYAAMLGRDRLVQTPVQTSSLVIVD